MRLWERFKRAVSFPDLDDVTRCALNGINNSAHPSWVDDIPARLAWYGHDLKQNQVARADVCLKVAEQKGCVRYEFSLDSELGEIRLYKGKGLPLAQGTIIPLTKRAIHIAESLRYMGIEATVNGGDTLETERKLQELARSCVWHT